MKKTLTVVAILALVAAMLPAAFAQTSDQTSPSSSAPAASSPAASPSDSPAQTSPAQTSPAQTSPAQTSPSTPDQSSSAQGSASAASQDGESFTGTVVKSGDKYVLKTDTGTYQIDAQAKEASTTDSQRCQDRCQTQYHDCISGKDKHGCSAARSTCRGECGE